MIKSCTIVATVALLALLSAAAADDACTNTADVAVLAAKYNTLHTDIQSCALSCLGDASCVSGCLATASGLSPSCASCFGAVTACGASNCYTQCMASQTSDECTSCTLTNCQPALLTCTGLEASQLPPNHGGCDTAADKAVFAAQWNTFYYQIRQCTLTCNAEATCTSACLVNATGVSPHCSDCYGAVSQCGAANCYATCISDPFGSPCQTCALNNCQPAFVACTGLAIDAVPPNHGACDDTADKAVFTAQWNTYYYSIQTCAQSCNADAGCVSSCLANATGTSSHCAQCFGDVTACGAAHCYATCINAPFSDECSTCTLTNCQAAMSICTGLDATAIPPSHGACNNDADKTVFAVKWNTYYAAVKTCALQCNADAACTTQCLATATGTSTNCSSCWGDVTACGASNCYAQCIADPSSETCTTCTLEKCQSAMLICTGLTPAELPPNHGACANLADKTVFAVEWNTFYADIRQCTLTCNADSACTANCLAAATGVSAHCSQCYGAVAACGASNCYATCISDPFGSNCQTCTLNSCQPAFIECTGLPMEQVPPNHGACDDEADKAVFASLWNSFYDKIRNCTLVSNADSAMTAACLATATGVSAHCSQCYGDVAQCGAANCYATCISDPFGSACQTCALNNCQPAFVKCTGLTMDQVPPNHGACDDDADKAVFSAQWNTYHTAIETCAQSCNADAACVSSCLANATGTSAHCAQCFGDVTACGAANCYASCISAPLSEACTTCTLTHCQAAMTVCTGLEPTELPPSTAGACQNSADQATFATVANTFHESLSACAGSCNADASCTSSCIATATSISSTCSACFGAEVACGAANCYAVCITAQDSPACELCTRNNCDSALASCTGLPVSALPAGSCENIPDLTVIAGSGFATQLSSCQTSAAYASAATATCLTTAYSTMTSTCATCYGAYSACWKTTCAGSCRSATSAACVNCRNTCKSTLNTCAGVAAI